MSSRGHIIHRACLATALLAATGCGGAPRGAVTGNVTLDGQPVDGGTIIFTSPDPVHRAAGWTEIVAGQYSIPASRGPAVGPNRVEIRWPRKTGGKARYNPTADQMREAVPDRYNRDSELQADVKPGTNRFDFVLDRLGRNRSSR